MPVELKGLELKGDPLEASQQLINTLREHGVLPSPHMPDPRVPKVSLTVNVAKTRRMPCHSTFLHVSGWTR